MAMSKAEAEAQLWAAMEDYAEAQRAAGEGYFDHPEVQSMLYAFVGVGAYQPMEEDGTTRYQYVVMPSGKVPHHVCVGLSEMLTRYFYDDDEV